MSEDKPNGFVRDPRTLVQKVENLTILHQELSSSTMTAWAAHERAQADAESHLRWCIGHVHTLYAVMWVQVTLNVILLFWIIWLEVTR